MQEFKHSVKVPRNYKLAASILKRAVTDGASVKSLLYEDKLKHFRTDVLYALVSEAIKHNAEIEKLFESTEILKNEPRLDPWLAKVLTVELLYGKESLPGKSKPELTIASYKEKFEKHSATYATSNAKDFRRPRYVRVNTNLLTTSDAIRVFQDEGYRFVRCTSGSYNDFLEQVKRLEKYDFMQDYHVKMMFVFTPGTKLHEHPLYLEHKIILHDKATALAVHLLAPPPGSVVMDLCAAPGMKTTQLAAYLRNQGTVYAAERSIERYQVLCELVQQTGSNCVRTLHKDSFDIRRGDYDDVEYVLLDPSCSGSGMDLSAHSYMDGARLARLSSWQEKFLKHAMNAFPNVKRIIYSTCSVFPEENERVVTNVVSRSRHKWNVMDAKVLLKDQWNNFGSGMYGSMGTRCLYAKPESDLTTGFFLAVLEKDKKYFSDNAGLKMKDDAGPGKQMSQNDVSNNNDEINKNNGKRNKKKEKNYRDKEMSVNSTETLENYEIVNNNENQTTVKAKKKKKYSAVTADNENGSSVNNDIDLKLKKKKKKHGKTENEFCNEYINSTELSMSKKQNKRKIHQISEDSTEVGHGVILDEVTTHDKIKKNKKEHSENVDDLQHCDVEAGKEKRKRKKESKVIAEQTNNDVSEEVGYDFSAYNASKKMKKKKRNKNNDMSVLIPDSALDELETPSKKKKKKKRSKNKDMSVLILNSALDKLETRSKKAKYAEIVDV